jgi:hypothetical protein
MTANQTLQRVLGERYPWVRDLEIGPRAVEAGECDACGLEPRLVQTCGPGPVYLGRRCAAAAGTAAWCAGHEDEADAALRTLAALPAEADDVARMWWVATGEVAVDVAWDPALRRTAEALTAGHPGLGDDGR